MEAIEEGSPAAVTLRQLARRVGVSHAAPAYHFGDRAGLLTAIAAEGFRRLADALRQAYDAAGNFRDVGVAYVRFAVTNRAHFDVMYRPELYDASDPEVVAAREAAGAVLYGGAAARPDEDAAGDPLHAGVAAWSLMHGLATLWINGNLPPSLDDDPAAVAHTIAGYLFRGP